MWLEQLTLRQFRNLEELSLPFSARKNLFLGKNGQGKTNLLEAIYFLSNLRSPRASQERELIAAGQSFAVLQAELRSERLAGLTRLEAQWQLSAEGRLKALFKLNGLPVKSRSQLLGYLPTVSFFGSDLALLRGAPEDRRRWLDAAIVQWDKRHFNALSDYQRIRLQKSRLLKAEEAQPLDLAHLEIWNAQLARAGAIVIERRLRYLSLIAPLAALKYAELSQTLEEPFELRYSTSLPLLEQFDLTLHPLPTVEALEEALLGQLAARQTEEIRRGACLVGPHRDDVQFMLGALDSAHYGSQGQQRSIVLALKLAELLVLSQQLSEPPLLLLDDVMAELDPDRQRQLIAHLAPESQVFLTTTHLEGSLQPFLTASSEEEEEPRAALYQVEAGKVALRSTDERLLVDAG